MNAGIKKKLLLFGGMVHSKRAFCGPLNVNINILSGACNSHCVMCKQYSRLLENGARETVSFSLPFLKGLLRELEEMKVEYVTFCADGEPFLHPDMQGLLEHLHTGSIRSQFITNGVPINACHVRLMDAKTTVRLSIHASNERLWADITGLPPEKYAGIIGNAREMKRTGARVVFHSVISRLNYADLPRLVLRAHECGADEVSIGPVSIFNNELQALKLTREEFAAFKASLPGARAAADTRGIETNFDDFMSLEYDEENPFATGERYRRIPCYVGWLFTWIDSDGNVTFCCNRGQAMGNIRESGFKDIWHGERYNRMRHAAYKSGAGAAECRACANYMVNYRMDRILGHSAGIFRLMQKE